MAAVPHASPSIPSGSGGRLAPALKLVKAGPDSQLGTPVRVFALVLVIVAVVGGLGMFVLGGTAEAPAAPKVIVPYKDRAKANAAPGPATPAATPTAAPASGPAAKPVARKAKPKRALIKLVAGLPTPLTDALRSHPTAVVVLYSPKSSVAEMARAEAQEGAKRAGVPFVALNVYDKKHVDELAAMFEVLNDPMVLVFKRPGTIVVRLDGFADRELVAQAAANGSLAR